MTQTATPETAIAEHGIIGDLQTAALITTDGSVDWFCCPRFDSPSVFGALLDPGGGHFRIRPSAAGYRTRQMYFPDTAVLIARWTAARAERFSSAALHVLDIAVAESRRLGHAHVGTE